MLSAALKLRNSIKLGWNVTGCRLFGLIGRFYSKDYTRFLDAFASVCGIPTNQRMFGELNIYASCQMRFRG